MSFLDDLKFRDITTRLSYQCTEEKLRDLINDADVIWLNKCGNAFIRNAISIIYNRHYYIKGSSWVGGRVTPEQIEEGEVGRLFVNMSYVLMVIKKDNDFVYVKANEFDNPSFDIFIDY